MTPPTIEERVTRLEERNDAHKEALDGLRADVKTLPAAVVAQMQPILAAQAKRNKRRIRAHVQKMHAETEKPSKPWPETIKEYAVGLSVIGTVIGCIWYGVRDARAMIPDARPIQTQQQGGSK